MLSVLRTYGRFAALAAIAVPAGIALLLGKRGGKRLTAALCALMIAEFVPIAPFPSLQVRITPAETELAAATGQRPLVLPAYTDYAFASRSLYWAGKYGKDTPANIALDRVTDPASRKLLLETPILRELIYLREGDVAKRTVFGQEPGTIAGRVMELHGITEIVLFSAPEGGLLALPEDKPVVLDADSVNGLRNELKSIGFSEQGIGSGIYVYLPPPSESGRHVVLRGDGFTLSERTADRTVVGIGERAELRIWNDTPARYALAYDGVLGSGSFGIAGVRNTISEGKPSGPGETDLGAAPAGMTTYAIAGKGDLRLINPRIVQK